MAAIKHLFHISAPRHEVYEAISAIEGLMGWWTVDVSGDSNPGGTIAFRFGPHHGPDMKITSLKKDEEVCWECTEGQADWIGTTITFRLDENEGKTRVRFTHDGWKETNDHYAAICFTWGRFMESLRQLCQAGEGVPFGDKKHAF